MIRNTKKSGGGVINPRAGASGVKGSMAAVSTIPSEAMTSNVLGRLL